MRSRPSHLAFVALVTLLVAQGCGEAPDESGGSASDAPAAESPAPAADGGETAAPATAGLVDPNEATRDQLLEVPHIDAPLADDLLTARPFDDMLQVDAILQERLTQEERDEVYARLFKPLDLNAASGAEILLIPGVGERMEHEFEEYRPYRAMEEFRREIGKYVDEAEVRRLERYVALP